MISTTEFNALGQDAQVAAIRRLGEAALAEFGIVPTEIAPLVHAENTTFQVDSHHGRFNLRISRPGYQSTASISSEIAWLAALRSEGHRVPAPYQERVVTASVPEVPEPRDCVLFRWMNGEIKRSGVTAEDTYLTGRAMARLHDFVRVWTPPPGFVRSDLRLWAVSPREPQPYDAPHPFLNEEDRRLLIEVDREARDLLGRLPRTPETFGLIHSDMHPGNLIFEDGEVNVIDFDDAGYDFFLYDFAAALAFSLKQDNYPAIKAALLDGYQSVRPLPPGMPDLLPPFLRLRSAGICNWVLQRQDNPFMREHGAPFIASLCEKIRLADR